MYHRLTCQSPQVKSLTLFALVLLSGCATPLNLSVPKMPWQKDDEKTPVKPEKIVAFWSDTVLHQQGQPGVRGFGGRLFFYGSEENKAVEVDGAVIVYAFDADSKEPTQQKPERKFVFTAEQLPSHLSQSRLGPSYSLWLPWDGVGEVTRNISLVVRFEGTDGTVVLADPVSKLLPGSQAPQVANTRVTRSDSGSAVQQVSYEEDAAGLTSSTTPPHNKNVESIDLPPSFIRQLQSAPVEQTQASPSAADSSPAANHYSTSSIPADPLAQYGFPEWNPAPLAVADSPPDRYGSPRFPAQRKAIPLQGRDPLRRGLHPATWLSSLPPTPRSGWSRRYEGTETGYPAHSGTPSPSP
jgi:hypothetical protein